MAAGCCADAWAGSWGHAACYCGVGVVVCLRVGALGVSAGIALAAGRVLLRVDAWRVGGRCTATSKWQLDVDAQVRRACPDMAGVGQGTARPFPHP